MIKLVSLSQNQRDLWLAYELGGQTISKRVYEMKGEFHKGERLYRISFNPLYYNMFKKSNNLLKTFIQQMAYSIDLLN